MATLKQQTMTRVGEDVEELEPLDTAGGVLCHRWGAPLLVGSSVAGGVLHRGGVHHLWSGVCHIQWYAAAAAAKSLQSCPTLCDPRDSSPPGSPIPGILQARTLEWVAISFSSA